MFWFHFRNYTTEYFFKKSQNLGTAYFNRMLGLIVLYQHKFFNFTVLRERHLDGHIPDLVYNHSPSLDTTLISYTYTTLKVRLMIGKKTRGVTRQLASCQSCRISKSICLSNCWSEKSSTLWWMLLLHDTSSDEHTKSIIGAIFHHVKNSISVKNTFTLWHDNILMPEKTWIQ